MKDFLEPLSKPRNIRRCLSNYMRRVSALLALWLSLVFFVPFAEGYYNMPLQNPKRSVDRKKGAMPEKQKRDQRSGDSHFSSNIIIFIEKDRSFTKSSGDLPMLYISLFSDGAVNRYGSINESFTGPVSNSEYESEAVVGVSEDNLYDQLLRAAPKELIKLKDSHWKYGQEEAPYHLYISIYEAKEKGTLIEYYYSSEGPIPPAFIREFVKKADALTDEW